MYRLLRRALVRQGRCRCLSSFPSVSELPQAKPTAIPKVLFEEEIRRAYVIMCDEIRKNGPGGPLCEAAAHLIHNNENKTAMSTLTMSMAMMIKPEELITEDVIKLAGVVELACLILMLHDDIVDQAYTRRGKPGVLMHWTNKDVTWAGVYNAVLALELGAKYFKNQDITLAVMKYFKSVYQGELVQAGLGPPTTDYEKEYWWIMQMKSLNVHIFAAEAVAIFRDCDERMKNVCYELSLAYGFVSQIIDDVLDFATTTEALGKTVNRDILSGSATAPVFFACEEYPELKKYIARRFSQPGDPERATELVLNSQGLQKSYALATTYRDRAMKILYENFKPSPYRDGMEIMIDTFHKGIKHP